MSFQNIANQMVGQVAGAMTAGKVVDQQKESLNKQDEALIKQQKIDQLQQANLGLKAYTDTMNEYNEFMKEYNSAKKNVDDAKTQSENLKKDMEGVGEVYNRMHDQNLDELLNSKFENGTELLSNFRKYDEKLENCRTAMVEPYKKAYEKSITAYNAANRRFQEMSGHKKVMDLRKEITTKQRNNIYDLISDMRIQDIQDQLMADTINEYYKSKKKKGGNK